MLWTKRGRKAPRKVMRRNGARTEREAKVEREGMMKRRRDDAESRLESDREAW
jgi:hypothetical protein